MIFSIFSSLQFVTIVLLGDKMKCPFCNVIEAGAGTIETRFLASEKEEVNSIADKRRSLDEFIISAFLY